MKTHGVIFHPDGKVTGWTWHVPSQPCPFVVEAAPGAEIVYLDDGLSEDELKAWMRRLHELTLGDVKQHPHAGGSERIPPDVEPAPEGHTFGFQPGYRRAVHCPQDLRVEVHPGGRASFHGLKVAHVLPGGDSHALQPQEANP